MTRFQTSSGDLLADRRADYAEMLFAVGEHAAAAEIMLGALELAPGWSMGWFRLGEFHEAAGAVGKAVEAWRMARLVDPEDHAGAALKLVLCGEEPAAEAPPSAFVEALFDQYAEKFDLALVGALGYRGPELLASAILARRGSFGVAVDLGCGTGLMGERLRPFATFLEGIDISAAMLRKARAKGVYDLLVKADLQSFSREGQPADIVTAADVLLYVGALDGIAARVSAMLRPGGIFAFSVERLGGAGRFALQPSRRYAHSEAYVSGVLAASGMSPLSVDAGVIRQDRGEPVEALIVVATRV